MGGRCRYCIFNCNFPVLLSNMNKNLFTFVFLFMQQTNVETKTRADETTIRTWSNISLNKFEFVCLLFGFFAKTSK